MIQAARNGREADPPQLLVDDLHYAYTEGTGRREVLRGVSLNLHGGECLALLGRSGSGKSTLLNLIAGIETPASGSVVLHGHELTAMSEHERTLLRRRHIGFVHQTFNLLPELTVAENLRLPLQLNGLSSTAIHPMLEAIGLADRANAYPDRLSGGEQQRVAIARALVHEPLLVLADEPTGSLDAVTGRQVLDLLLHLVRSRGRMLLMVTHAREVAAAADHTVDLADGRLTPGGGAVW
ncbi:MAG: ABC transporter ATP-binding protein [Gammaproteobacteria bacterium]|jgi:putative ABC transport system ATP-binding protein|nr:ABC transporter ATP-binding protein [Gammaproteobacteria bacterium]